MVWQLLFLATLAVAEASNSTSKRGLLYISSATASRDSKQLTSSPTDLTWYYNYAVSPSSPISSSSIPDLEFAPMLWDTTGADTFASNVRDMISEGVNIRTVLAFNEPDQTPDVGGSHIDPELAAAVWKRAMQPLAADGIRLSAPAVSGSPNGIEWLKTFMSKCNNCTISFIPLHWYGSFEGLEGYLAQVNATFPNIPLWITELAWNNQTLGVTTDFFNKTLSYLDSSTMVERYSWFGAFRSDKSNVGPNVAFLDSFGKLTDLGAEYLEKPKTGVQPTNSGCKSLRPPALVAGLVMLLCIVIIL